MEDNELKAINFKVSAEEFEAIDRAAHEHGLSRSDFIRQRLSNPSGQATSTAGTSQPSKDVTMLLQHVLYGLHCVHAGLYAIAESAGTITTAQAEKIAEGSLKASRDYLSHLDEKITAVREQIKFAEPELESQKPVLEVKADGLARSV
jgi:hypothetical protein